MIVVNELEGYSRHLVDDFDAVDNFQMALGIEDWGS
jgi:hypothetical protein